MNVRSVAVLAVPLLGLLGVEPGWAQTVIAGGAVGIGIERFGDTPAPNRLDGAPFEWSLFGGVELGPFMVRLEGWRGGDIDDRETTSVVANGKPVTIQSSLTHDAHAVAILADLTRNVSSRLQVALGGGVSSVTVTRRYTTDAGALLLVPPSTVPTSATTTQMVDRFAAWSLGADVFMRAANRVRLMATVRGGPLRLKDDINGLRVRLLAGAVWTLR